MTNEPQNGQPHVRFDGVQKSYDSESLVVKDLNLDIAKCEFLTMLGPSDFGKTTCLMMLTGFETVTGGEKRLVNALERQGVENHIERLRQGHRESVENSALFVDMLRDPSRFHSHLTAVAYPILDTAGEQSEETPF